MPEEKNAKKATAAAVEYTLEDLATAAVEGKLGGKKYSRAMVAAALKSAGKERASVADALSIIDEFCKKKVK